MGYTRQYRLLFFKISIEFETEQGKDKRWFGFRAHGLEILLKIWNFILPYGIMLLKMRLRKGFSYGFGGGGFGLQGFDTKNYLISKDIFPDKKSS